MNAEELERRVISEEKRANPSFAPKIDAMLQQPGGQYLLSESITRAVANEFDPSCYPESKGEWVVVRRIMNEQVRYVADRIKEEVDAMPLEKKMEVVRAIARGEMQQFGNGMGEFGPWIELGTALFSGASQMYGSYVTSQAQQDVAKIRAEAAVQQAQLQLEIAQATQAIKTTVPKIQEYQLQQAAVSPAANGGIIATISQPVVAGIPLWAIPAGIAAIVAGYFLLRRRR